MLDQRIVGISGHSLSFVSLVGELPIYVANFDKLVGETALVGERLRFRSVSLIACSSSAPSSRVSLKSRRVACWTFCRALAFFFAASLANMIYVIVTK